MVEQFKANLRVFQDTGKLGAVLFQYPTTFKPTTDNKDALRFRLDTLSEFPCVVEFHNALWFKDGAVDLLRELNVGCCVSDLPEMNWFERPHGSVVSNIGYIRLYGRNLDKWRTQSSREERFDYQYSEKELREWAPRIIDVTRRAERTYVYALKGRAVANARQLRGILSTAIRWE